MTGGGALGSTFATIGFPLASNSGADFAAISSSDLYLSPIQYKPEIHIYSK